MPIKMNGTLNSLFFRRNIINSEQKDAKYTPHAPDTNTAKTSSQGVVQPESDNNKNKLTKSFFFINNF